MQFVTNGLLDKLDQDFHTALKVCYKANKCLAHLFFELEKGQAPAHETPKRWHDFLEAMSKTRTDLYSDGPCFIALKRLVGKLRSSHAPGRNGSMAT
jgi:hypothetical protein